MKNGLTEENGELVFYKDDRAIYAGVVRENDGIYYVGHDGKAVRGLHVIHSSHANGILAPGTYLFGDDYRLVPIDKEKNGLCEVAGHLLYYKDGMPFHAGVIKVGEDLYYIAEHGFAVKGKHNIHRKMANGLLKRGTYTFGEDHKLVADSYQAPKKNKKKKKKRRVNRNQRIAALVVAVLLLVGIAVFAGILFFGDRSPADPVSSDPSSKKFVLPSFENEVVLCSASAKEVYTGSRTVQQALRGGEPYRPFVFEYQLEGQSGTLEISESSDLKGAKVYTLPAEEKSLSVDNLKTGATYYYRVSVNGKVYPGYFRTAESTRFVFLPGVKNTRDLGGYTTTDGKKVRQGMLIRGSEIDGLVESSYFLEKNAVASVQETFGFVCDLDLRNASLFSGKYQSRLGDNVRHLYYTSALQNSIFSSDSKTALRSIFSDLAKPGNYPMYLHCTYGTDRTGTVCFLLEGVLDLPEDVMQNDYRLSGFFDTDYANSSALNTIYGGLEGYAGETVQEKIVTYLTEEVGVTPNEIESIREIFLED